MTRHLLVGYLATSTGRDALNLGIALAREQDARLHVVMIAPQDSAYAGIYPHDRGYGTILERQLGAWLDEALACVPEDVPATGHVLPAESDAEGLLAAAAQLGCSMIVLGGRRGGLLRRYRLGSVATTLLHSAPIPVALSPAGHQHLGPVGRLTAMFGPRPGAVDVVGLAIQAARRRSVPLRLVSLVLQDLPSEQAGKARSREHDDGARPGAGLTSPGVQAHDGGTRPDAVSSPGFRPGPEAGSDPRPESGAESGTGTGAGAVSDPEERSVLDSVTLYAHGRLAEEAAEMVERGTASTLIATGRTVDHALDELDWRADDVVIVGSSRLAARGRLFLGSTAAKMLRTVPVPVVVVPAGHLDPPPGSSRGSSTRFPSVSPTAESDD